LNFLIYEENLIFFFYQCVQASFPKQTKYDSIEAISVVDPDTAFRVNLDQVRFRIWIQGFYDKKLGKILLKFWAIYLSLGLLKASKLQEKPSALKREHPKL
jgi:hypothetical protein